MVFHEAMPLYVSQAQFHCTTSYTLAASLRLAARHALLMAANAGMVIFSLCCARVLLDQLRLGVGRECHINWCPPLIYLFSVPFQPGITLQTRYHDSQPSSHGVFEEHSVKWICVG